MNSLSACIMAYAELKPEATPMFPEDLPHRDERAAVARSHSRVARSQWKPSDRCGRGLGRLESRGSMALGAAVQYPSSP